MPPPDENPEYYISLTGGIGQNDDGTWHVVAKFDGLSTEAEARQLSDWLRQLIDARLSEVATEPDDWIQLPEVKN